MEKVLKLAFLRGNYKRTLQTSKISRGTLLLGHTSLFLNKKILLIRALISFPPKYSLRHKTNLLIHLPFPATFRPPPTNPYAFPFTPNLPDSPIPLLLAHPSRLCHPFPRPSYPLLFPNYASTPNSNPLQLWWRKWYTCLFLKNDDNL